MRKLQPCLLATMLLLPFFSNAAGWEAEGRLGLFLPQSKEISQIYGDNIPEYQFQVAYRFCNPWSLWANISYVTKSGRSLGSQDSTYLNYWPLGIGVQYSKWLTCDLEGYLGAGALYSYVRFRNNSPYVPNHISKSTCGAVAKSGLRYHLYGCAFLELFCDYQFNKFHFNGISDNIESHDVDLSGFLLGIGAGVAF